MKPVYFDNAATTPLDPQVLEAMMPYMTDMFGNPSSIHSHGNKVRSGIEKARKKVADLIGAAPSEIFFTSGGTEADNTAIRQTILCHQIKHVISSPTEHHAVLHTLEGLEKAGVIELHLLKTDEGGNFSYDELESLLRQYPGSFVSLMHGNNEIGNLSDMKRIGDLCQEHKAFYHSDTVQTVGHFPINVKEAGVHMIAGAAHKFHGPKGVGFLYLSSDLKVLPFITGGSQERNMRGGTENVYGIVGLAKAFELAVSSMESHMHHIRGLKAYMIDELKKNFPDIAFNGASADLENSLYTVLNVCFPKGKVGDMLLFSLDIQQISASGGSACSSGSDIGSHVLKAIGYKPDRVAVRFSFSKYNTKEEVDYVIAKLKEILTPEKVSS